jgi:plastocyanin
MAVVLGSHVARGTPPQPSKKPQPMTVVMVDDRFIPDRVEFQAGVTYRLRLENHSKELHEFTAPGFFAATKVVNPHLLSNGGKEVVVQPGQTVSVVLTPRRAGEYDLICADHDWDGMVGKIVVH